jgi:hypothetical protein
MSPFKPHMEVLSKAQKKIWPALGWTKTNGFVLYGGTAVALWCGHRASIDFDFFTDKQLNHEIIHQELQKSGMTTHVVQDEKDSLTLFTEPDNVKLSFFGDLGMGRVGTPTLTDDGIVSVASPLDLLGTKLKVVMQRAEAKDYIDIAQLLRDGSSLSQGLGAARSMYGSAFAPAESLRALTFFNDGDLAKVDATTRQELRIEAARVSQMFPIPTIDIVGKRLSDEGIVQQGNRDRGDRAL